MQKSMIIKFSKISVIGKNNFAELSLNKILQNAGFRIINSISSSEFNSLSEKGIRDFLAIQRLVVVINTSLLEANNNDNFGLELSIENVLEKQNSLNQSLRSIFP